MSLVDHWVTTAFTVCCLINYPLKCYHHPVKQEAFPVFQTLAKNIRRVHLKIYVQQLGHQIQNQALLIQFQASYPISLLPWANLMERWTAVMDSKLVTGFHQKSTTIAHVLRQEMLPLSLLNRAFCNSWSFLRYSCKFASSTCKFSDRPNSINDSKNSLSSAFESTNLFSAMASIDSSKATKAVPYLAKTGEKIFHSYCLCFEVFHDS